MYLRIFRCFGIKNPIVFTSITFILLVVILNNKTLADKFLPDSAGTVKLSISFAEIYPWEPITDKLILPTTDPIPAEEGSEIYLAACRGEYEPASFVIRALEDLNAVKLSVTDLIAQNGETIRGNNINIKVVKCWYQAGKDIRRTKNRVLVPELLLKDDSLIKVDYEHNINYIKTSDNKPKYLNISANNSVIPQNAVFNDTINLIPFNIKKNTNKQIMVTAYIPEDASPGKYIGSISITTSNPLFEKEISLIVHVLPFVLPDPKLEYSLYYRGKIPDKLVNEISSEWKTETQYERELRDMLAHGVTNPTIYQSFSLNTLKKALSIRTMVKQTENLYVLGLTTGNPTSVTELTTLKQNIDKWIHTAKEYGYKNIFFYGMDEAKGEKLISQRHAWETVHRNSGKVFVSCYEGSVEKMGDLLDLAVLHGDYKPDEVDKWHKNGKKVYIYANPQVGIENPLIYRKNYGFILWKHNYDGVMDYAYQHGFRDIWNDFDDDIYRDHVFSYPTSNGLVETIQWVGFREAVDDSKYLAALLDAKILTDRDIQDLVEKNYYKPSQLRKKIIDILIANNN